MWPFRVVCQEQPSSALWDAMLQWILASPCTLRLRLTGSAGSASLLVCCKQELQPQLQALENQWFSLHTLTGANTPEEVVTFWEGGACIAMQAIDCVFVLMLRMAGWNTI